MLKANCPLHIPSYTHLQGLRATADEQYILTNIHLLSQHSLVAWFVCF